MKTVIPKINIKIDQYWSVFVNDYHQFRDAQYFYKDAGIKVKYQEIGCYGLYEAVFWIGKKPVKHIKKKIKSYENATRI